MRSGMGRGDQDLRAMVFRSFLTCISLGRVGNPVCVCVSPPSFCMDTQARGYT